MMLIKITGESVKFIGSKHIQESHINMSLQLYISYLNKHIVILRINISLRLLRSVNTLNSKLKFKTILNKQITATTESSVSWSHLNFPKVFSKTLLYSSTLRPFLSAIRSYTLHIPKPHSMSEKLRKIKKIANYQNIIVRNCPALGDEGRFPFNKNSGLKIRKLHVLNETVHYGFTDRTQATSGTLKTQNYTLKNTRLSKRGGGKLKTEESYFV